MTKFEVKPDGKYKLKPCPFCGGEDVYVSGPYGWYRQYSISHSCSSFHAGSSLSFKDFTSEFQAVEAWNNRG